MCGCEKSRAEKRRRRKERGKVVLIVVIASGGVFMCKNGIIRGIDQTFVKFGL